MSAQMELREETTCYLNSLRRIWKEVMRFICLVINLKIEMEENHGMWFEAVEK